MQKSHLHAIKWAIAQGYTLNVWGDGEELDYVGNSYQSAKEATEACDTAEIILKDSMGAELGWFYIVNGLDAEELVSDYSDNEIGQAWQKSYDAECYPEVI